MLIASKNLNSQRCSVVLHRIPVTARCPKFEVEEDFTLTNHHAKSRKHREPLVARQ